MKTQISHLINGSRSAGGQNVISNVDNTKGGTSYEERQRVAALVLAENPTSMRIRVRGIELTLTRGWSTTGKTTWYAASITDEQFERIVGVPYVTKFRHEMSIEISDDMKVTISTFKAGSDSPRSAMRQSGYTYIGEDLIEILEGE